VLKRAVTRLQIVQLNEKDVDDCRSCSSRSQLTSPTSRAGYVGVLRALVGNDWGWWRTLTQNVQRIHSVPAAGPRAAIAGCELDQLPQHETLAQLLRCHRADDTVNKAIGK